MEVFVKSFSDYKTIKHATVISGSIVLDSLDYETSTLTVAGNAINRSDAGNWLIAEGQVFRISGVKPDGTQTEVTVELSLDAFSRPLELETQPSDQTIGGFISQLMEANWVHCDDPNYAIPYLVVSDSGTAFFAPPDTDNSGCFTLPDYCRLMRKSNRVSVTFQDAGSKLSCVIKTDPDSMRQIGFEDGHSQLVSVAYSASGLAKVTAIQDIPTGEKDANGNAIYLRERTHWYLSESGNITQIIPEHRATGEWGSVYVPNGQSVQTKVAEAFAKNKKNHKLEFWSDRDLNVHDSCAFLVYGELLKSYISHKRKDTRENRFYYKSGELATTASEKLKGVTK